MHRETIELQPSGAPVLNEYLDEDQLAAQIGKSIRTLARWRRLREGPAVTRIGRSIVYHRDDVRAWLSSCRREAGE